MPKRPPTPTPLSAEHARPRRVARTETMATVTTNASEWTSPIRPRLGSVGWSPQGPIVANGTLNGRPTATRKQEPVTPRLSIADGTRTLVVVPVPGAGEKSVDDDDAERGENEDACGSEPEVVYTSDADEREKLDIPLSPGMERTRTLISAASSAAPPPSPAMPLVPSAAADVQSVLGNAWAALPAGLLAVSPLRLVTVATAVLLIVLVVGTVRRAALRRRCATAIMSSEKAMAPREMAGVAALVVVSEKGRRPRMTTLAVDAPMPTLYASEAPVSMAKLILSRQVSRRPSFPSPRRARPRISLPATGPHSAASPSAPLSPLGRWMARTDPHA
ncbi:hypothetical protein HMN09_00919000 [Mycena chlorophos]|uniref:Uncharacterized protein n=1 Tax=Mycena chlorophos TaxID=658473 RepID=A0A8H6SL91_MYCCL|nr:hypothetical protein HMN09_00919000 [Mycena chlorophos]